ncbi:hypothetical protein V6B16_14935, partial [Salinimicrobium catena]|uniref:hypothetical protein n=1 Tax=Salinimicrobium catena TaxID=390640 RepID=UPI002FE44842
RQAGATEELVEVLLKEIQVFVYLRKSARSAGNFIVAYCLFRVVLKKSILQGNLEFKSFNHKPQTTNHKPQTTNHKPQTPNS